MSDLSAALMLLKQHASHHYKRLRDMHPVNFAERDRDPNEALHALIDIAIKSTGDGVLPIDVGEFDRDDFRHENVQELDWCGMERLSDGRWVPRGRMVQVPILPSILTLEPGPLTAEAFAMSRLTIDMVPVRMGVSHDRTRIRWWNWYPSRGQFEDATVEADVVRAARKVLALSERFTSFFESNPHVARDMEVGWGVGWDSLGLLRTMKDYAQALEEWLGLARVHVARPPAQRSS
jgi:hypothetical protein